MNLALFDFDGTITYSDTFTPFLYFALPRRRLVRIALELGPMIASYKLGRVPATTMRMALVRVGFRGRLAREIDEIGARYAEQHIARVLRPNALERIAWHRAEGDRLVVVSASLEPYLKAFCRAHELELIGAELETKAGVLTGEYVNGDCTAAEKARRVVTRFDLASFSTIYAYGDSVEDRELLALAQRRFFRWEEATALP